MKIFAIVAAASAIAVNKVAIIDNDALELGDGPSASAIMAFCDTNKDGSLSFWEG